jgi:ABC-type nitrate/sulfonate/bicarbonate transport system permease component
MTIYRLTGAMLLIMIWWLISHFEFVNPILLPPPDEVAKETINSLLSETFFNDLWLSTKRVLLAFGISVSLGIPFGIVLGRIVRLSNLFEFPIDFFRSLPATALYPLFMLFFGIGEKSILLLATFASFEIGKVENDIQSDIPGITSKHCWWSPNRNVSCADHHHCVGNVYWKYTRDWKAYL